MLTKNKFLNKVEATHLDELLRRTEHRDSVMLRVARVTGARATELLSIKVEDLDPLDRTVFLRGLKGSRDRSIPIKKELFLKLRELAESHPTKRPFPISYPRLVQVWYEYRPVRKCFHSLRHTFAVELYRKTKDIKLVQIALGHKSMTSTLVYADFVYAQDELRRLLS